MNLKKLAFVTCCTAVLGISFPWLTYAPIFADATQIAQQTQETSINLSFNDLKEPYLLRVKGSADVHQLTGKIELDGKLLQNFNNNFTQINLSPYLTKGSHIIKILGGYRPVNSSIQIELKGRNTQVSQETSGSGEINQTLIIEVE